MCGISGIYNFFNKEFDSRKTIEKIIKIQNSRGPDENGMWISNCNKITLGHNRLSIIDLSDKAKQPFISKDGNFNIKKLILTGIISLSYSLQNFLTFVYSLYE